MIGNPSRRDELPMYPQIIIAPFAKWAVDLVVPINPLVRRTSASYIITTIDYLTRWEDASAVKDYSSKIVVKFLFKNVVTRLGCPRMLRIN